MSNGSWDIKIHSLCSPLSRLGSSPRGALCAMVASSSLLGSAQPGPCLGCPEGPLRQSFLVDMPVSELMLFLLYAPDLTQGSVSHRPGHQVHMLKLQNKEHVSEALGQARFKFPGHQKKQGFTQSNAGKFEDIVAEKQHIFDVCGAKYMPICDSPGLVVAPELLRATAVLSSTFCQSCLLIARTFKTDKPIDHKARYSGSCLQS